MANHDEALESLFGPAARFTEFEVGQVIRYRSDGMERTGEITWVTAPGKTARGTEHPTQYWIGLDCIYQTDIIEVLDEARDRALERKTKERHYESG